MKRINEYLIVMIFILTGILAAVVGLKAYETYDTVRRLAREQEELELAQVFARNEEAQSRVQEMRTEIQELTKDKEKLEQFLTQVQQDGLTNVVNGTGEQETTVSGNAAITVGGTVSGNVIVLSDGTVSGNAVLLQDGTVSGNAIVLPYGMVSGDAFPFSGGTVSSNMIFPANGTVSGNAIILPQGTVSGNTMLFPDGSVSANSLLTYDFSGSISGNGEEVNYYDGSMTNSSIFDAWRGIYEQPEGMTLAQRRELRTSLEETLEVNQSDRERIAENRRDFSGIKIACLGDSITAGSNLEGEEDYQQYSYPARLKELLGAEEVYNLGIGGSSIGRYWADAYVDRYQDIPEDTDIIIVMGGTNDGFCVSDKEFGSLEEKAYRTFCGDLDELMRGLRDNYPDAEVFFATPLPNVLQDYLMKERDYLLPQQKFVDVMLALAGEYDYEVIDLYNSNILDSHDANVVADYMPDGVHGNHDGYQIMAEHFAAEIIEHYDETDQKEDMAGTKEQDGEGNKAGTEGQDGKENKAGTKEQDGEESAGTKEQDGEEDSTGTEEQGEKGEKAETEELDGEGEKTETEEQGGKGEKAGTGEQGGKGEKAGTEEQGGKGEKAGTGA